MSVIALPPCTRAVQLLRDMEAAARRAGDLLERYPTLLDAAEDPAAVAEFQRAALDMATAGVEFQAWFLESGQALQRVLRAAEN